MFSETILAEVAFDLAFLFNDLTDAVQLILVERCDLHEGIYISLSREIFLQCARVADAEDVSESDARLFVIRDTDSSNTCQRDFPSLGSGSFCHGVGCCLRAVSAGFNASLNFG